LEILCGARTDGTGTAESPFNSRQGLASDLCEATAVGVDCLAKEWERNGRKIVQAKHKNLGGLMDLHRTFAWSGGLVEEVYFGNARQPERPLGRFLELAAKLLQWWAARGSSQASRRWPIFSLAIYSEYSLGNHNNRLLQGQAAHRAPYGSKGAMSALGCAAPASLVRNHVAMGSWLGLALPIVVLDELSLLAGSI
jgi:hypothetical protein